MVVCKLIQDVVDDKEHLIFKISDRLLFMERIVSGKEYLFRFPGDQVVADIIFIFKI